MWVRFGLTLLLVSGALLLGWAQQPEPETKEAEKERVDGTVRGIIGSLQRVTLMVYSPRQVALYLRLLPNCPLSSVGLRVLQNFHGD